jgi:hypothetical protein
MRRLVGHTIALPVPMWEWIETQAAAHGLSRNAYLAFVLHIEKTRGSLADLEKRVSALEEKPTTSI